MTNIKTKLLLLFTLGLFLLFLIFNFPAFRSLSIVGVIAISIILLVKYRQSIPSTFRPLIFVLVLGLLVIVYLFINNDFVEAAMLYALAGLFSLAAFYSSKQLGVLGRMPSSLAPVFKKVIIGGLAGGFFIFLNIIFGVTIGIPTFPLSVIGKFLVVSALAPIFEEFLFRVVLLKYTESFISSNFIQYLINAALFAAFHLLAYTSGLYTAASISSVSNLFIGALLFGFIASALADIGENENLGVFSTITMHMIFNTYILSKMALSFIRPI